MAEYIRSGHYLSGWYKSPSRLVRRGSIGPQMRFQADQSISSRCSLSLSQSLIGSHTSCKWLYHSRSSTTATLAFGDLGRYEYVVNEIKNRAPYLGEEKETNVSRMIQGNLNPKKLRHEILALNERTIELIRTSLDDGTSYCNMTLNLI